MNFNDVLSKYKRLIDNELEIFLDRKINEISGSDQFLKELYTCLKEYVLVGGKRLRPILFIMAYKAFNGKNEQEAYIPSLSVELFHNATLVQDDFMDEDDFRRNNPTVYYKIKDYFLKNFNEIDYNGPLFNRLSSRFSVTNAALGGNILFSMSLSVLPKKELIDIINNAYKTVNDGQALDVIYSLKDINEKDYFGMSEIAKKAISEHAQEQKVLDMISKKTGALIEASLEMGAVLANAKKEQIKKMKEFGKNLALGFQLWDDVMDLSKNMNKGHELGSDIKKGKKTLIILHALKNLNKENKEYLLKVLGNENASKEEIEKSIQILNSSINYAKELAEEKIKKAKEILKDCRLNKEGYGFFNNLAEFIVKREI